MEHFKQSIRDQLAESASVKQRLGEAHAQSIVDVAAAIARAFYRGNKVLLCGNGGSASDAQHIAAEFVGRFRRERRPLPSIALTANGSTMTAIGNDYRYEVVFERQVQALGKAGDIFIGITTSGKSPNVVAATRAARELGLTTVTLTGGNPSPLSDISDIHIAVPSTITARVQETHILICHLVCEMVDELLFPAMESQHAIGTRRPAKLSDLSELLPARDIWRRLGLRVVWTNGCFDLIHTGHLKTLQAAKALGDILIVGVNSDDSVRRIKGDSRPVIAEADRAEMVAALDCVDHAVIFNESLPTEMIARLQPDVHTKGEEYRDGGRPMPEREVVFGYGGTIEYLPLVPGYSTSSLIERIVTTHTEAPAVTR